MDSMAMAMSPYSARYARVVPGGMRRTNVNPGQAPSYGMSPAGGAAPVSSMPMAPPAPGAPFSPSGAGVSPAFNPALGASYAPTATPSAPPAGAGTGIVPSQPYNPLSLDSNITKFQNAESGAVQGYGDMVGQDFTKSVGNLLGNLNEIGGLRSGGVQSGINDFATQYGRQIGDYAKMTATDATHAGQEEYDAATERQYRADAEKRARKNSLISGIGGVLGGVAGAYFGGPAGASAGAKIGGSL